MKFLITLSKKWHQFLELSNIEQNKSNFLFFIFIFYFIYIYIFYDWDSLLSHASFCISIQNKNDLRVYEKFIKIVNLNSELNDQSCDSLLYSTDTKNENNQVYKKSSILIVNSDSELNCHMIHSCTQWIQRMRIIKCTRSHLY